MAPAAPAKGMPASASSHPHPRPILYRMAVLGAGLSWSHRSGSAEEQAARRPSRHQWWWLRASPLDRTWGSHRPSVCSQMESTNPKNRPEFRQEHPLNLSISISGGQETNQDSPSSGERTGISPSRESPSASSENCGLSRPLLRAPVPKFPGRGRPSG